MARTLIAEKLSAEEVAELTPLAALLRIMREELRACEGISASRRLLIWRYGIVPFAVEFMT
jgi:hypothetical protein